jgi:small-conductance mechanosensitive channel
MMPLKSSLIESLKNGLSVFSENVYIQALVAVVLSLALAKLSDWIITRVIMRATLKTKSELDDRLIKILHRPIFVTVLLIGLTVSFLLVTPSESIRWFWKNSVATLVILIWVTFGVQFCTIIYGWLTREAKRARAIQPATRPLFETASKLVLIALGIYFILVAWGVDPFGWLATAGIAAVALGLAAQDTLGNLFAGISIMADAPYKLGDYIVLDGQERGEVTKIGLRSTRVLTRDDIEVTIPNSVIASSKIINETSGRWIKQRLRIPVSVAYGSDVLQAQSVLLEAAEAQDGVSRNPEPWVKFCGFGESSLDLEIRCWIEDPRFKGRVTSSLNTAAYLTLAEHGIEIPYPKRDVYIKELPESFSKK